VITVHSNGQGNGKAIVEQPTDTNFRISGIS
jgi:hypothetical protein